MWERGIFHTVRAGITRVDLLYKREEFSQWLMAMGLTAPVIEEYIKRLSSYPGVWLDVPTGECLV
jgi:hypothetical protein